MAKIVLLILVVLAVIWFFTSFRKGRPPAVGASRRKAEKMVVCAHCRLHFPESESIAADGRHYCCEEHRRRGGP